MIKINHMSGKDNTQVKIKKRGMVTTLTEMVKVMEVKNIVLIVKKSMINVRMKRKRNRLSIVSH